jgi:hypothetical protein
MATLKLGALTAEVQDQPQPKVFRLNSVALEVTDKAQKKQVRFSSAIIENTQVFPNIVILAK